MSLNPLKGLKPALIAVAVIGCASAAYFAVEIIGARHAEHCCATGFDATPYEQVPVQAAP